MTLTEFRSNLFALLETCLSDMYAVCCGRRWEEIESALRKQLDLRNAFRNPPMTAEAYCACLEEGPSRDLFLSLQQLRTNLARQASVPPYVICSNRALYEMALREPRTIEELKEVHGIGEKNSASYGEQLLAVIRQAACPAG